jgi:hypothetical protein
MSDMSILLVKSPVVFDEKEHRYWLNGKELFGVTSTLIKRAFPDKYKDVAPEVLAQAAEKGHRLHELIEYHDNFKTDASEHDDPRIASYDRLKREHGLITIANEYTVSDEERYASQIDIVMANLDGEVCLVDTKTTYNLDKLSTALQLSIYKRFFERQNPTLKVAHIYVLWLPNKDTSIAELHELEVCSDEYINALIEVDKANKSIETTYGNLPARLSEVEDEIIKIEQQMKAWKERQDTLKKGLYDIMSEHNIKSYKGGKVLLTRVLPSTTETLDSKRLKEEQPEIYKQYVKTTNRSGSLKITIQNQ